MWLEIEFQNIKKKKSWGRGSHWCIHEVLFLNYDRLNLQRFTAKNTEGHAGCLAFSFGAMPITRQKTWAIYSSTDADVPRFNLNVTIAFSLTVLEYDEMPGSFLGGSAPYLPFWQSSIRVHFTREPRL
jgi:hypothetical protein